MCSPDEILADVYAKPMMASILIDRLQRLVAAHGDLPVVIADKDVNIQEAIAYDANGNTTSAPVEIGLHSG